MQTPLWVRLVGAGATALSHALRCHPAGQPWLGPRCQGSCWQMNAELLTNAGGFSVSKTHSLRRHCLRMGVPQFSVCLALQALFQSSLLMTHP